jgi:hypothetical protein
MIECKSPGVVPPEEVPEPNLIKQRVEKKCLSERDLA